MGLGWAVFAGVLSLASPHVRSESTELQALLREGIGRSEAIASRVARLEASDVVVYVEYDYAPQTGVAGFVRFVTASNGWRYIRISLRWQLSRQAKLVMLGHELQHAVEIADASDVVDEPSLVAFYTRSGSGKVADPCHLFDTPEAVGVEQVVMKELRTRAPSVMVESAKNLHRRDLPVRETSPADDIH